MTQIKYKLPRHPQKKLNQTGLDQGSNKNSISFPQTGGAVTVGNFDGVHLGHKKLIETTIRYARLANKSSVLYTFYPHPVQFLYPEKKHRLLCSFQQSQECLRRFDLDHLIVQPFTKAFAQISPQRFIDEHILARFQPEWIVVGTDFRFGAGRTGSVALLKEMAQKHPFKLKVIAPVQQEGMVVSTSAIKELVSLGQWDKVRSLLGRRFAIKGQVVKGAGRGQKLGFPTLNLQCESNMILPPRGVYAGFIKEGKKRLPAVLNLGYNPTFSDPIAEGNIRDLKIEVHIIGQKKRWQKKECEVEIGGFIRPEKKFSPPSALVCQIQQDIKQAQRFFQRE